MKLNKINSTIVILLTLVSCQKEGKETVEENNSSRANQIFIQANEASGAYFTHDEKDVPVLCWTEKAGDIEGYLLRYARYNIDSQNFDTPVTVTPSKGTRAHDESMNKIAFKKDGTVVGLFAVKHPTKENRFAGSILYTLSTDQGYTWSVPDYLHSDTAKTYGRSYFDMAVLPDGEVAAVWLDGRHGEKLAGSALFFAKTSPGGGFGSDHQIGETTCECCRTDIFIDSENNIHVAYRDILFPPELMGQQVRDMVHSVSSDGGKTFTAAQRISEDNWAIEGCPHTGPSLAANRNGLHAVWFTASGDPGVYYARSADQGSTFSLREKVSNAARFPQITVMPTGDLVFVWSESKNTSNTHQHTVSGHTMHTNTAPSYGSQIMLQVRGEDGSMKEMTIIESTADVSHPVITPIGKRKALVAWTTRDNSKTGVYYSVVNL